MAGSTRSHASARRPTFAGRSAQIARDKIADRARDPRVRDALAVVLHRAASDRWNGPDGTIRLK
jgi:hypothetical protein